MFRLLLKDVATKKMVVNFRELTSYLMKEAGMDEELPELVDKMATIKMIGGMFLFLLVNFFLHCMKLVVYCYISHRLFPLADNQNRQCYFLDFSIKKGGRFSHLSPTRRKFD